MAKTRPQPILNYLRRVLGVPADGGVTDAELLRRFVHSRDEAAFELLLWRHAAMVLHVCRNVLRENDDAEDAFQATFLVFVRKAAAIRRGEQFGGWLYRVAYHTALKARAQRAKRRSAEERAAPHEAPVPDAEDAEQREQRRLVCEEVNRLPARYRTPIVACFFEGKTHEEAAHQLGWPRGTLASRLARGRELLRRRLVRRGVALSVGALASAWPATASQVTLTGLIRGTLQTVEEFVAGAVVSPRVAALVEGVLRTMYWTRIKFGAIVVLLVSLTGVGATFLGAAPEPADEPEKSAVPAGPEKTADEADEARLTRDMAQSRLNLRKLVLAMHAYADKNNGALMPPAIYSKDGKALLSWRVALLPYLDQENLYKQFHLDEPWDSSHNRELSEIVVKVYAPVGKPDVPRFKTYYQVFVSTATKGGGGAASGAGKRGGSGGVGPRDDVGITAAFVKGRAMHFPAHFTDGTSNTILIAEAGNPVPWTKPEDLHYAQDEPLPELGGLFADVIQVAYADGEIAVLTKRYDEATLRCAITANGGEVIDEDKIVILRLPNDEAPKRGRPLPVATDWEQKNELLHRELERARVRLRLLRAERAVQGKSSEPKEQKVDPRLERLKRENARLQGELDKINAECEALLKSISRRQKPADKPQYKSKS